MGLIVGLVLIILVGSIMGSIYETNRRKKQQEKADAMRKAEEAAKKAEEIRSRAVKQTNKRKTKVANSGIVANRISADYISKNKECFIAVDTETTGLSSEKDRIVEISAVRFCDFVPVDTFSTLINQPFGIPEEASRINHITDADLKDAPSEGEAMKAFFDFIGEDALTGKINLVAHNAPFDRHFIEMSARRCGMQLTIDFVDTIPICKQQMPGLKNYKLGTVAKKLNIEQTQAHRAADDALVCGKIFVELLKAEESAQTNVKETHSQSISQENHRPSKVDHVSSDTEIDEAEAWINITKAKLKRDAEIGVVRDLEALAPKEINGYPLEYRYPDADIWVDWRYGGHYGKSCKSIGMKRGDILELIPSPSSEDPERVVIKWGNTEIGQMCINRKRGMVLDWMKEDLPVFSAVSFVSDESKPMIELAFYGKPKQREIVDTTQYNAMVSKEEQAKKWATLTDLEREVCIWVQTQLKNAGCDIEFLSFDTTKSGYLSINCWHRIAKMKTRGKQTYILVDKGIELPAEINPAPAVKSEGENFERVFFSTSKGLEPVTEWLIYTYKKVSAETRAGYERADYCRTAIFNTMLSQIVIPDLTVRATQPI